MAVLITTSEHACPALRAASFIWRAGSGRSGNGGANTARHIHCGIAFWNLLAIENDMNFRAQDNVALLINPHISDATLEVPAINIVYFVVNNDRGAFPCGSPTDGLAIITLEFVWLAIKNHDGGSSILMPKDERATPVLPDRDWGITRVDKLATKVWARLAFGGGRWRSYRCWSRSNRCCGRLLWRVLPRCQ